MISLTRSVEYYGLRYFLNLILLILFVITGLVSLRIVTALTSDIVSVSGTSDRNIPSPVTSTAIPITGLQQSELKKEPPVRVNSDIFAYARKNP
jgi:hypothetical protein